MPYLINQNTVGGQTYDLTFKTIEAPIITTAADTPANWKTFGCISSYYDTAGQLTNQPSQYGFILSLVTGSEVSQLWFTQPDGKIYRRSGNASGWFGTWREIYQEGVSTTAAVESIVPIRKGGTNAQTADAARSNLGAAAAPTFTTFSGTSLTAENNTEYANADAIASLAITLPAAAQGVMFSVNFTSSSSFSGITFSSGVSIIGDSVSLSSRRYNLVIWYDGSRWWCAVKAVS